jgi:small conductance mechanosensitive channel
MPSEFASPAAWQHWGLIALHICLILLLAVVLRRVAYKALDAVSTRLLEAEEDPERDKSIATLTQVGHYIITVLVLLVSGMLVLSELGISIAPILAAAGVLGIAVGFGAQSLVKDYFTGLFMLLENQIRQGDVVEIAGKSGLVEQMTLRYTRLRDYNGNVHTIPNGLIETVTNSSRGYAHAVIDVGIAYREDIDTVYEIMRCEGAALRADPEFADKIETDIEIAGVEDWAESAVILRCRFRVKPLEQWGVRRAYLYRLKKAFDTAGIEIPFPHLTIYAGQLKDGSAPPLRLVKEPPVPI